MIKIKYDWNYPVHYTFMTFSGGEEQIKIETTRKASKIIEITANIYNSADIMKLLLITDALKTVNAWNIPIHLTIPYLPYSRQDRVCAPGEALSLKVMADLINSLHFASVTTWDVHSEVALALIDRVINIPGTTIVRPHICYRDIIVAPDAGALKKLSSFGSVWPVVRADKHRDVSTGQLTDTIVYTQYVGNKDFLIIDDICDGGATFIALAKALKPLTAGEINLYVTHGIFSKGLEVFEGYINRIYCAHTWPNVKNHPILRNVIV